MQEKNTSNSSSSSNSAWTPPPLAQNLIAATCNALLVGFLADHMFLFFEKFHTHSIRIRATTKGKRGNRKCSYAKHDPNMIWRCSEIFASCTHYVRIMNLHVVHAWAMEAQTPMEREADVSVFPDCTRWKMLEASASSILELTWMFRVRFMWGLWRVIYGLCLGYLVAWILTSFVTYCSFENTVS